MTLAACCLFIGAGATTFLDSRIEGVINERIAGMVDQLNRVERRQLEREMRDTKALLCRDRGNRTLLTRIDELQADYRHLNEGRAYEIPSCEMLGVEA